MVGHVGGPFGFRLVSLLFGVHLGLVLLMWGPFGIHQGRHIGPIGPIGPMALFALWSQKGPRGRFGICRDFASVGATASRRTVQSQLAGHNSKLQQAVLVSEFHLFLGVRGPRVFPKDSFGANSKVVLQFGPMWWLNRSQPMCHPPSNKSNGQVLLSCLKNAES